MGKEHYFFVTSLCQKQMTKPVSVKKKRSLTLSMNVLPPSSEQTLTPPHFQGSLRGFSWLRCRYNLCKSQGKEGSVKTQANLVLKICHLQLSMKIPERENMHWTLPQIKHRKFCCFSLPIKAFFMPQFYMVESRR